MHTRNARVGVAGDFRGRHRAARSCPYQALATQGHTPTTVGFTATLVVEAAIHYLDMTVALATVPEPDPAPLALVRRCSISSRALHWQQAGMTRPAR